MKNFPEKFFGNALSNKKGPLIGKRKFSGKIFLRKVLGEKRPPLCLGDENFPEKFYTANRPPCFDPLEGREGERGDTVTPLPLGGVPRGTVLIIVN